MTSAISMPAAPAADLGDVLFAAVRAATPLPARVTATVALRPYDETGWTLVIRKGRLALEPGSEAPATTTICGSAETLRRIATGEVSGLTAFLQGAITVRGDLSLSMRLAGMWAGAAAGVTAGDVVAEGQRTFYIEAGEGPPVVLLHGLGATNASMLPTLEALSQHYRVIAPDLPGFGDSDKPLRSLHAAFYARWLKDFCAALDAQRPHLIGNSMGGRIAVEAGLRNPDDVGRLVLLAPSPAFLRGREYVRLVRILRPELALLPLPLSARHVVAGIRGMFSKPSRLDRAWYEAAADEFLRVFRSPRGRICFFSAMRQIYLEEPHAAPGGFWGRLPQLTSPALFVWGDRDRLVPAKFSRHVERALPDAESVVLADCGHVPQYEHPQRTHDLIQDFLAASA